MKKCIEIKRIFKNYVCVDGEHCTLSDLSFSVDVGEICALTGASGCGKSTLLNCILGMLQVNSGSIKLFNQRVEFENTSKFAKVVGFVPQQMSLAQQLTVYETLQYFSHLHTMDGISFRQRFVSLTEILELPPRDRLISEMSGGEQRRVSLAVAILHRPQLLILDEPTVGLDFEIRNTIWNFFRQEAQASKLTVLITTHCFNETMKADRCCYMRDGKITINSSPQGMLERFECETITELFSKMTIMNDFTENPEEDEDTSGDHEKTFHEEEKNFRLQVIWGLVYREFHRLRRQPINASFVVIVNILIILLVHTAVGKFPDDLTLAIVNGDEIDSLKHDFVNQIEGVLKVFFDTFEEAEADFKRGNLIGILSIADNFTAALPDDVAKVDLDGSKFIFSTFIKQQIVEGFWRFLNDKSIDVDGFVLLKPIHVETMFQSALLLEFVSITSLVMMAINSVFTITECRTDGIWNRSLLSGTKMTELGLAYMIQCFLLALVCAAEVTALTAWLYPIECFNRILLMLAISFDAAITGFLIGFLVSIVFHNALISSYSGLVITVLSANCTEVLWPLVGKSRWVLPLSYAFPTTLPNRLLKDVILRGSCSWMTLFLGCTSMIVWKVTLLTASYKILKYQKFYL